MGFDWKAFAGGAMSRTSEILREKKTEAEQYKQKQEELAERNIATISRRNAAVNKVMGLTNMLTSKGVSEEQIQAAIATGPDAIVKLADKVQAAVELNGGKPLGESDVEAMINLPEDFSPVDMELDEYIKRSYGAFAPKVATSEQPELSFWDKLTGDGAMAKAKQSLRNEAIYEDMTAADINAMARQDDYNAIIPSTFATFTDFKTFNVDARMDVQKDIVTQISVLEETDPEYAAARGVLKGTDPNSPFEDVQAQRNQALNVVQTKNRENFGPIFEGAIDQYGAKAITGLSDLMNTYMGSEYVDDLMGAAEPAIRADREEGVETTIDLTGGKVEKTDAGITMSHPQVFADPETGEPVEVNFTVGDDGLVVSASADGETFEGEEAQVLFNAFESFTPQGTIARGGLETPALDVLPENVTSLDVTREEWKEMSRSERRNRGLPISTLGGMRETFGTEEGLAMVDLKRNANPDAFYKLKISGKPGAFKVKGSNLALIPDQALVRELGDFSIAEFGIDEDMPSKTFSASRLKRMFGEGSKMPISVTGDEEERTPSDMRPQARPEGLMSRDMNVREKAIDRFGLTEEDIQEAMDTGQVTEADLQILTDSGDELYEYVKDNLDPDAGEMQYYELLSNWADENNKILPANLGFLVFQLKKVVSDE